MMHQPLIRSENFADVAAIRAVTRAAFLVAEHSNQNEAEIIDALRAAGTLTVSLVAELQGQVIGHIAVSPVSISDGTQGWHGLGPVSVLPEFQRRGFGTLLMKQSLELLQELPSNGCVVLGDPKFYGRFGFQSVPELILPGVPCEYFLAVSFGAGFPRGVVAYHAAFGTLD